MKECGIGFRTIRDFNEAMSTKQVWRLQTNPDSLVSKIVKTKYYPNKDILQDNLGNRPIYL